MTIRGYCINLAHCSSYAALGVVVLMFALACYWAFIERSGVRNPYAHPVALSVPARNRAEIVEAGPMKPGDTFYVYNEACVPALPSTLTPYFQNSVIIRLPDRAAIGNGKCRKTSFRYQVPVIISPGIHYLHRRVQIEVNPLRTDIFELPPVRLEVSK